ncbi:hypothetical protein SLEP1_g25207 [Rubroshorea leprosula]|uniref:Uncharacterized protein n=1 Tax=Rubroshorea leprosula TaxID=152421 RepID=A0AAV5JRW7_9ROSI|nr:hypothetical protein SLEP1_g25207 [Rubroshorea leprosula]
MRWCGSLKPVCVSQRATISVEGILTATSVIWFAGMKGSLVADAVVSGVAACATSFINWQLKTSFYMHSFVNKNLYFGRQRM